MRFKRVFDPFLNDTIQVPSRFYFFTAYHGSTNWEVRRDVVEDITKVKLAYPEFNVLFYHEMVECVDLMQYTSRYKLCKILCFTVVTVQNFKNVEGGMLLKDFWFSILVRLIHHGETLIFRTLNQTLGVVLLITIGLTALFLPVVDLQNLCPIILMGTSFIGINATVIGMLQFWGVDIDLVMMVCLLMSVGFSVDYTVHMAFTYARQPVEHGESSAQRVRLSFIIGFFEKFLFWSNKGLLQI